MPENKLKVSFQLDLKKSSNGATRHKILFRIEFDFDITCYRQLHNITFICN